MVCIDRAGLWLPSGYARFLMYVMLPIALYCILFEDVAIEPTKQSQASWLKQWMSRTCPELLSAQAFVCVLWLYAGSALEWCSQSSSKQWVSGMRRTAVAGMWFQVTAQLLQVRRKGGGRALGGTTAHWGHHISLGQRKRKEDKEPFGSGIPSHFPLSVCLSAEITPDLIQFTCIPSCQQQKKQLCDTFSFLKHTPLTLF